MENSSYYLKPSSCQYMLDRFNIVNRYVKIPRIFVKTPLFKIVRQLIKNLYIFNYNNYVITENEKDYCKYKLYEFKEKKDIILRGYWQNYRYFDEYKEELRNIFQIKKQYISSKAAQFCKDLCSENSVALHIRRGDYPDKWRMGIEYYLSAIEYISNKVQNPCIYIFSQEREFAEKVILKAKVNKSYFLEDAKFKDLEEFYLMCNCKHFIISNSTFSWWAAYLATNPTKRVVAPIKNNWDKDFYLPDWKTI